MIDRTTIARVAVFTLIIGIFTINVSAVRGAGQPPLNDDEGAKLWIGETQIPISTLATEFVNGLKEKSEPFKSIVNLVTYVPAAGDPDIDPDLRHCSSVKRDASVKIVDSAKELYLRQCANPLVELEDVVDKRVLEFLEVVKSVDQLAYEDASSCVEKDDTTDEEILECFDKVFSYRELSFVDYLDELKNNYRVLYEKTSVIGLCEDDVRVVLEDQVQKVLDDVVACAERRADIGSFFAETSDKFEELSENERKAVLKKVVMFSMTMIIARIDKLKEQLDAKYLTGADKLVAETDTLIAGHRKNVDLISRLTKGKVDDTERLGAHYNQCSATIGEEVNIRAKLAIIALEECVQGAKQIQGYFQSGMAGLTEDIELAFEGQKALILTCTGIIGDLDAPTAEELERAVDCTKLKLIDSNDKVLVQLEERVDTFLSSVLLKISQYRMGLDVVNICMRVATVDFKEIMQENVGFMNLCVEESKQLLEKDEL